MFNYGEMIDLDKIRQREKEGPGEEHDFRAKVVKVLGATSAMLFKKNKAYGNSALDPIRVFSQADPVEQLKVRIDDKLSRLKRGEEFENEDTILDLIGYLVLLKIAMNEREEMPGVQEGTPD